MSKSYPQAQNPLILRYHRLLDAFAKSDDERDFYLDRIEGFILFVDLDKGPKEIEDLEEEISDHKSRYCLVPKMTFYETKKFMEGFVNEKVYDIDTKEKLLDVIQSKEARENFLEFIYDHLTELEKWQQYYQERSRIRIIEWLRNQQIQFVFEEDLDLTRNIVEKLKRHIFDSKVQKDVITAREALVNKAKTYYSNEALNPRPKRGRPPKQVVKVEVEPQLTMDMYTTVPLVARMFVYLPETTGGVTFSARYDSEAALLANLRGGSRVKVDAKLEALSARLESLRTLSSRLGGLRQELSGMGKEEKLIKAVSQPSQEGESRGLLNVVKGFLPTKRGGPASPIKASTDEVKKPPTMKTVTQIQKKGKKK
jgi:hypothetical protein